MKVYSNHDLQPFDPLLAEMYHYSLVRKSIQIPFDPQLDAIIDVSPGKWGIIIAHGKKSSINSGFIPTLMRKLEEKKITSLAFNFPFRQTDNRVDDIQTQDMAYQTVWEYATQNYPNKTWILSGHGLGAEAAIRSSGLVLTEDGLPPLVISIAFPLYPPNRPENVNPGSISAVIGDALFIQPENSNQGTFGRLRNQVQMMAPHAEITKIRGANHGMEVEGKTADRVSYWVANDIERFLKNRY